MIPHLIEWGFLFCDIFIGMKKFIITEEDRKHIHSLYGRILSESFNDKVEELDNWIENNSDYISEHSLKEMVEELFGGVLGDVESHVNTEKDSGGDEYGENWSRKLITITNNGEPLIKVWVTNDYRYDFGKNSTEFGFGERFKFNQDALY